jgi:hypothetical protein
MGDLDVHQYQLGFWVSPIFGRYPESLVHFDVHTFIPTHTELVDLHELT